MSLCEKLQQYALAPYPEAYAVAWTGSINEPARILDATAGVASYRQACELIRKLEKRIEELEVPGAVVLSNAQAQRIGKALSTLAWWRIGGGPWGKEEITKMLRAACDAMRDEDLEPFRQGVNHG